MLVVVIYSKQTAGKSSGFSECYEDGFVDLSFGVNLNAHMEENHTTEYNDSGDDQLCDIFGCVFHGVFEMRCKGSIKKRSHQKSEFALD